MKYLFPTRLAEILYALIMGFFGVAHFMNVDKMTGMIPDYLPGDGSLWVYLSGAGLIAAALAILINKFKMPACYLLALMLIVIALIIHLPAVQEGNPGQLLKDLGLAMAALIIGNKTGRK
ncbi:MAG: DoxX family membrane protein [Chitinophagaceae bacterium]|nr:DoxX family membrane protein [Chitinophagaceae bacterium]